MRKYGESKYDILRFIYAFQPVPRKAIRCFGYNYYAIGDAVDWALSKEYISESTEQGERYLRMTKDGVMQIQEANPELTRHLHEYSYGVDNKARHAKFVRSVAMLHQYVPGYVEQYLDNEKRFLGDVLYEPSQENSFASANNGDSIKEYVRQRISSDNSCFISVREMRLMDNKNLRKISGTRASGILHLPTGNFAVYNVMRHQMLRYLSAEEKYSYFIKAILNDSNVRLIAFGTSFSPALSYFRVSEGRRQQYFFGKHFYAYKYYVVLNSNGAKQLEIYATLNFREIARNALVSDADIDRAKNLIYDGRLENGDVIFVGMECDLSEIQIIMDVLTTRQIGKKIIIYCFEWQCSFYHELFGNRADIKAVDFEPFMNFVRKEAKQDENSDSRC